MNGATGRTKRTIRSTESRVSGSGRTRPSARKGSPTDLPQRAGPELGFAIREASAEEGREELREDGVVLAAEEARREKRLEELGAETGRLFHPGPANRGVSARGDQGEEREGGRGGLGEVEDRERGPRREREEAGGSPELVVRQARAFRADGEDDPSGARRSSRRRPAPRRRPSARAPAAERRESEEHVGSLLGLVPRSEAGRGVEEVLRARREGASVLVRGVGARVEEEEPRAERLAGAGRRAEVPGAVGANEEDVDAHSRIIFQSGAGLVQNARVAKQRSDEEQKAVETNLRALAHRLQRLRDEAAMQALRGETDPGVEKGLDMALRELNGLLPRRKRVK